MGAEELRQRMRLLDNEIRIMRSDTDRIRHESSTQVSCSQRLAVLCCTAEHLE